jgi:hypothetical protein
LKQTEEGEKEEEANIFLLISRRPELCFFSIKFFYAFILTNYLVFCVYNMCRERGARALEERLGMKGAVERAASAPQGLASVLDAQETGTSTAAVAAEPSQDLEN